MVSNSVLEFLQEPRIKPIVSAAKDSNELVLLIAKEYENDNSRVQATDANMMDYYRRKWVAFERCFWSVKNYPETNHIKPLRYPRLNKASDLFNWVRYYDKNNKQGIYICDKGGSKFGDVLKHQEAKVYHSTHFPYAYCELRDGIIPDVSENMVGAIKLIKRPEGFIVIAEPKNDIGSDWLAIITEWDIDVELTQVK
jgi:hypothetical protein